MYLEVLIDFDYNDWCCIEFGKKKKKITFRFPWSVVLARNNRKGYSIHIDVHSKVKLFNLLLI